MVIMHERRSKRFGATSMRAQRSNLDPLSNNTIKIVTMNSFNARNCNVILEAKQRQASCEGKLRSSN